MNSRKELPDSSALQVQSERSLSKLHPCIEGKARRGIITNGGKTQQELLGEFGQRRGSIRRTEYSKSMIQGEGFITLLNQEHIDIVIVQVQDLAIQETYPTVEVIYKRIDELDLVLLPAAAAVHYRLEYVDQPLGEVIFVGMDPIAGIDGGPSVFGLAHDRRGLWLFGTWVLPEVRRRPEDLFVFGLRS